MFRKSLTILAATLSLAAPVASYAAVCYPAPRERSEERGGRIKL